MTKVDHSDEYAIPHPPIDKVGVVKPLPGLVIRWWNYDENVLRK